MSLTRSRASRHPGTFPLLDFANPPPLIFPPQHDDWRVLHLANRLGAPAVHIRAYLDMLDAAGGAP